MLRSFTVGRETRVNLLLGSGHFLSHFYQLCLPPLFIAWVQAFDVSFAELGLVMAVMSATAALLQTPSRAAEGGAGLLLSRSVLMYFAFFMVTAMAGAGIQSWLITILHQVHGLPLAAASSALTGYMVGQIGGVLAGGWMADRTAHHLPFVVVLTIGAAAILLLVGVASLPEPATIGVLFAGGLMTGARNTPRDVMVKDAAPLAQIGKVFGFVSSGMSLGGAIMTVPYGMIIDAGRPELVLVVVAALLLLSLSCAGGARVGFRRAPVPVAAE